MMHWACFQSVMEEANQPKKALSMAARKLPAWSTAEWNVQDAGSGKLP